MKMNIIRVQKTLVSGISKTGNPYDINNTSVTVQVPVDTADSFGQKEMTYLYGDSGNFNLLTSLKGKLPLECDVELGAVLNSYGDVITAITDVKVPQSSNINGLK